MNAVAVCSPRFAPVSRDDGFSSDYYYCFFILRSTLPSIRYTLNDGRWQSKQKRMVAAMQFNFTLCLCESLCSTKFEKLQRGRRGVEHVKRRSRSTDVSEGILYEKCRLYCCASVWCLIGWYEHNIVLVAHKPFQFTRLEPMHCHPASVRVIVSLV